MTMTAEVLPAPRAVTDVEIVVPVFNEEQELEPSLRRLHAPTTPAPTPPGRQW